MTQRDFRHRFGKLDKLATLAIQKIYLTATLPTNKEKILLEMVGADPSTRIIRAPLYQPRIRYMRVTIEPHLSSMEVFAVHTAQLISRSYLRPDQKGIIFAETIAQVQALGQYFGDCTSQSELHPSTKSDNEQRWKEPGGHSSQWIIATTGMVHGVDHALVGAVLLMGPLFSIYNSCQAAGRGGRGVDPSLAIVITTPQHGKYTEADPQDLQCIKETNAFTTSNLCVHHHISLTFNGHPINCDDLKKLYGEGAQQCFACNPEDPLFRQIKSLSMEKLEEPTLMQTENITSWSGLQQQTVDDDDDMDYDATIGSGNILNMDPSLFDEVEALSSPCHNVPPTPQQPPLLTDVSSHLPPPPKNLLKRGIEATVTDTQPSQKRSKSSTFVVPKPVQAPYQQISSSASAPHTQIDDDHLRKMPGSTSMPILIDQARRNALLDVKEQKFQDLKTICTRLRGKCVICWAWHDEDRSLDGHKVFANCKKQNDRTFYKWIWGFIDFGKTITYPQAYSYCYKCHLPQGDRSAGGTYMPSDHHGVFGSKTNNPTCGGLRDIVLPLFWYIVHQPHLMTQAVIVFGPHGLKDKMSLADLAQWFVQQNASSFSNAIELVLWYWHVKVGSQTQ